MQMYLYYIHLNILFSTNFWMILENVNYLGVAYITGFQQWQEYKNHMIPIVEYDKYSHLYIHRYYW